MNSENVKPPCVKISMAADKWEALVHHLDDVDAVADVVPEPEYRRAAFIVRRAVQLVNQGKDPSKAGRRWWRRRYFVVGVLVVLILIAPSPLGYVDCVTDLPPSHPLCRFTTWC
jgi:hypothetical protein